MVVLYPIGGEGNFHIFYYLYDGLFSEDKLAMYHLDQEFRKHHKYLSNTCGTVQANVNRWRQLKESFKVLGFSPDELDTVNRVLAAILNLGDLEFGEVITTDNTDNKARVIDVAPMHRGKKLVHCSIGHDNNAPIVFVQFRGSWASNPVTFWKRSPRTR